LVWPSNCGSGTLTLMTAVALERLVVLLEDPVRHRVGVDRARERGLEADQVRAALDRVDVVGEGVHVLRVALVPLQRDFHLDAVAPALQVDDVGMDWRLRFVQVLHEGDDAALVEELVRLLVALVVDRDVDAAIQERQLA